MHAYSDSGNRLVASVIPAGTSRLLDVGCGSGDTSRLIKESIPGIRIEGITFNAEEASVAASIMEKVHIFDLEEPPPASLSLGFDCILFSHVLEHLRRPEKVLLRLTDHLLPGGTVVIALPNVLEWRTRLQFLLGRWRYAETGILDRTHLRFFTFESVERELLGGALSQRLVAERKLGEGSLPLWPLRRIHSLREVWQFLDRWGVALRPNLFAQQIVLVTRARLAGE